MSVTTFDKRGIHQILNRLLHPGVRRRWVQREEGGRLFFLDSTSFPG